MSVFIYLILFFINIHLSELHSRNQIQNKIAVLINNEVTPFISNVPYSFLMKLSHIQKKLKDSINFYTKISTSIPRWPQFSCLNTSFKKGNKDPVIQVIRRQLILLKILKIDKSVDEEFFDEHLELAIQSFQQSHSLDSDGIVGQQTCRQLNMTPEKRILSIKKTIEQINQCKGEWGIRYILVNIPTYNLFGVNDESIEHIQPVIVGSKTRPTPLQKFPIQNIILNPSWRVPISIFIKDKLEKVLVDPEYLGRGEYSIYDSDGEVIEAHQVNWKDLSLNYFPYIIRQKPGKKNALGVLKFNLENDEAIYMHGTPDVDLFKREARALSSGCIRVKDPVALAVWVLNPQNISHEYLQSNLDTGETITIPVKTKIAVFTTNFPVWIDEKGTLKFGVIP